MKSQLIISIDGGGIRGIIPLILLKEIQQRSPRTLIDYDPVWWGTSTGALISGALRLQRDLPFSEAIQNVLDLYEFRSAAAVNPKGTAFPARALSQLIRANFSDLHLSDFPELNLVASDARDFTPVIFNAKNPCSLADAILASCAYPGIFPPVEINGIEYVDGYFNAKNPALLGVKTALANGIKPIVLSIGTGKLHNEDVIEGRVIEINDALTSLHDNGEIEYYRLNPVLTTAVDGMQNATAKNIFNLRKDVHNYIAENQQQLSDFIKSVNQRFPH